MKITVIGAGNGGQAIAGYLALQGYKVYLYDRSLPKIEELKRKRGIQLTGRIVGFGEIHCFTTSIEEAVKNAEIVMVTTVANAHADIARSIAPYISDGMMIILNPGRTPAEHWYLSKF